MISCFWFWVALELIMILMERYDMNELIEEVLQTKKVTCRMNEIKRVVVRHIQGYHTLARLDAPNGRKGDQTGRGLFSPQSLLLPTPL